MSDLHPSAPTMKPQDGGHQSMFLQLQNNTDFHKSSSSSSSSSSPDSTYSLSSMDVDMPEGIMGRKAATSEDDSGIQSPDYRPEENDSSVSVYLDAKEEGWHAEPEDQDNVTVTKSHESHDEVDGEHGDSSATEAQMFSSEDEEGQDEEDDTFMSLRSVDEAMRNQSDPEEVQMCSSNRRPGVSSVRELHQEALQDSADPPNEPGLSRTSTGAGVEVIFEVPQGWVDPSKEQDQISHSVRELHHNHESQGHHQAEDHMLSVGFLDVGSTASLLKESVDEQNQSLDVPQGAQPRTLSQSANDAPYYPLGNVSPNTNHPSDPSHAECPVHPRKVKSIKVDLKQFSRPNLKNVKPKINSRATFAPRPINTDQNQQAADGEKKSPTTRIRATIRRGQCDTGVRKSRASSTQARTTIPAIIPDTESKSTWTSVVQKQPAERSKTSSHIRQVQTEGSLVTAAAAGDQRGSHTDEAEVTEASTDGDVHQTVSSDVPPPVTRVSSRGCVSAAVRAAPLAGAVKMRLIDSSSAAVGSAPSWKAPVKAASSKLPIKSPSSSSVGSTASENKGVAQVMKGEETCCRPSSSSHGKSSSIKPAAGVCNRSHKANTAGQKTTAHIVQSKNTHNPLQRGGSVRPSRNSATVCPSSRGSRGSRASHTHPDEEEKNRSILHLRSLVAHGNRKLEALALVVQHIFSEREGALKQNKEISIQLKNLREELAESAACCERLECEKASVCVQLDAVVSALQQQHQAELAQLENTLRDFYSAEWDKAHQAYQDEADRCTALMRKQVEEVKSKQEVLRAEQEVEHGRQIEELRHRYEATLTEVQKDHQRDRQKLDIAVKCSEAALNERIASLMEEKESLSEQLRETEEKRKALVDKSQRDTRVVYLEQELESLKVVLEIKTDQLHQQDKKLMQMDKLTESNMKLEEFVTKLRQENEDYKARMDKHAELSRQLSTEQAVLQQTLQKESKANKRLSMENEELLWKLHNGLSPRNSACFPSSPVSPR